MGCGKFSVKQEVNNELRLRFFSTKSLARSSKKSYKISSSDEEIRERRATYASVSPDCDCACQN